MAEEDHAVIENQANGQRKIRGSVLDQFRHISNANEGRRLKNAVLLLKHLCISENSENDNNELKYALDRLIRGLGSSRNSARVGFYSTLVALLQTLPSLNVEQVLGSIQKQLQTGSSYSKSEIGDIYTGQILACGALIRSGMFLKGSIEEQKRILEQLLNAGKKRSYLALAASSFIVDLLNSLDEKQFESHVWPTLKEEILKPWPEQTLDSIYLLILIQKKFPQSLKPQTLKKCFGTREIFSEENISPVIDVMLNIAAVSSLKHSAYELISKEVATSPIVSSFVIHLDSQLRLNRNKLLAVSIIIRNILSNLKDQSQIPSLLTPNFMGEMLQYYRTHHNYDHDEDFLAGMTKFFESLVNCLKQDEVETKIKIAVLKKMLFYPGSFMIESITKSRILQQLVQTLDLDGIKKLSKLYKEVIIAKKEKVVGENITEPWLNAERIYASQLLVKLLSHPKVQNEVEWKMKYLKLLMNVSIVQHPKYTNVGTELASALREVFFRALDQKFSKLEDMRNLLSELASHLQSLINSGNYEDVLRVSLTEEEFDILQQMYATIKTFETATDENKYTLVFQILFLQMGLQLFKDKELATSSLKELFLCYEKVKNEKKQINDNDDETNDLEWIEVVIDLFLNLLSHSSHLLRNVICSVFPHLCKYITPSSMHQILSVLDPQSEINPLSTVDESDSENSDTSDEEEEQENGSGASEESGSEAEADENETVNDKLRMAVQQALGNDGYRTDEESIDLDEMSDSEGRRLDEALAQAFKEFKPNRGRTNKKKQTKNDETLTHFRTRVLDLLEIYLESEPAMLSCLEIMLPLLQTLEFTIRDEHQKPLQARVKSCLKKLTNLKKFSSTEGITETILGDLLNSLLGKGTKSAMMIQDMSSEISECSVFLIKCSQIICSAQTPKKTKRKMKEKFLEVLSGAVSIYFNQRDCLIPYPLFKSTLQLNWDGNLTLVPFIFEFAFNVTTRPFRRSQALELLKLFYLNRRIQINAETFKSHLGEHENQFCNKVIEMVDDFCKNPLKVKIKERFIYHVFNLLKAMASHPLKNEDINWKVIGEKVREYRSYVTLSKDAKTAYNQLCAKLNIPNIVKMKNQVIKLSRDQEDECDDSHKPSEKNKQQNKGKGSQNSKKLKKEARTLRFESMSEGFSNISFSNVDITNVKNEAQENGISDEESDSKFVNGINIKNEKLRKRLSSEHESENNDTSSYKKKKQK